MAISTTTHYSITHLDLSISGPSWASERAAAGLLHLGVLNQIHICITVHTLHILINLFLVPDLLFGSY